MQGQLPQILQLGLRELHASPQARCSSMAEVVEFLAGLPTPEEILALRPSAALQTQMSTLPEKSRDAGLSPDEERLWQSYEYLEHIVRLARAKAHLKLQTSRGQ